MSESVFNEEQARQEICEVGRRIWAREYVAGNDGNLSVRLNQDEILATPTDTSKGHLSPEMLVVIDREGNVLRGRSKPSTELKMHRALYDARPDVRGVCHAHPATATGFAVAGIALMQNTLPEVVIRLGGVPLCKYGMPGTDELTRDLLENYVHDYNAFLLQNHGVTTVGETLTRALFHMETVEHFARIALVARQLGGEEEFSPEQVQQLVASRGRYNALVGGQ